MRDTIWIIAKTKYLNEATIVFTYETITSEIEVLGMNRQMEYAVHSHPPGHNPHQEILVTATGLGKGYIHHLPHTAGGTTEKEGPHTTTIRSIQVKN